jgi:hypothetical protein
MYYVTEVITPYFLTVLQGYTLIRSMYENLVVGLLDFYLFGEEFEIKYRFVMLR